MNKYFKRGEVILIRSDLTFDERFNWDGNGLRNYPDMITLCKKNISIEDVRNFQTNFQKSSLGSIPEFKKIGCLIFDDISINAQNSLLKVFEDINSENSITLFTNKNVKLLPTIMSRVIMVEPENEVPRKNKPELPNQDDKENPIDKQQVIEWITYTIKNSKINKDKKPLIWINSPSPNIKYIIEYVNLFY